VQSLCTYVDYYKATAIQNIEYGRTNRQLPCETFRKASLCFFLDKAFTANL